MSLSNKKTAQNPGVWTQFGTDAMQSQGIRPNSGSGTFIALEEAGLAQVDFIPFCEIGNDTPPADNARNNEKKSPESIEQEAYEKGFAQGEKDGLELGREKAKKQLKHLDNLIIEIENLRHVIVKNQERQILDVTFAIAEKIILAQAQVDPDLVRRTFLKAFELTSAKNKIGLRVNPRDFELVEQIKPELFERFKDLKALTITSDPAVTRGGCLLESEQGEVDAGIETQLEKVYQDLKKAFIEG
jgi:flagellar assembly protein FliH